MPEITRIAGWTDMMGATLLDQLEEAGVAYKRHEVPELAGWGGEAYWLHYVSPQTDKPVAVLCVSSHALPDGIAEDYTYLDGVSYEEAQTLDWADVYRRRSESEKTMNDHCMDILDEVATAGRFITEGTQAEFEAAARVAFEQKGYAPDAIEAIVTDPEFPKIEEW